MLLFKFLILLGVIQGSFLFLLIIIKKEQHRPKYFLALWLLISSLQLLYYFISLEESSYLPVVLQIQGFSISLISAPVLYIYIKQLSFGKIYAFKEYILFFLPYLLFNGILLYCEINNPGSISVYYGILQFDDTVHWMIREYLAFLLAIVPGWFIVLSLFTVIRYRKALGDHYSYAEKINLNWLKTIIISMMVIFFVLYLVIRLGPQYKIVSYQYLFGVVGSILAIYTFFIGFYGISQTSIFTKTLETVLADSKKRFQKKESYKNSSLNPSESKKQFEKLTEYMASERPYLNDELTLPELASQMEFSVNHLSQIINQQTGSNFFDFVNGYRVEMVKQKLKDPSLNHFSLLAIAFDSGFRSKASFNKVFKKFVGKTPSEYKKHFKTK